MEGGLITPPAFIGTGPLMGVTSRATKAVGTADLRQGFLTLGIRSIALLELWEGKPLLELNGVASHDQSGTSV
jgi:hypothetical protein